MLVTAVAGWVVELPARADTIPGSGFGSFELSASAAGMQSTYSSAGATSPTAEGEVPDAQAQLQSGPIGQGTASIAWPGPIAANAGTTAVVLGAPLPPQDAGNLNDPARAQAETGGGTSTDTNNDYPGTTMTATASDAAVSSEADVDSAVSPAAGFTTGDVTSSTGIILTGPSGATVTAKSEAQNVGLAGGLIDIRSVSSAAKATTDGATSDATGTTVMSGVTVDSVPATIDQDGLHLSSTSSGAGPAAVLAADSALQQAGVVVYAGQPITTKSAGAVTYIAGSVVILWTPSSSAGTFAVTFGGLTVSASATPGSNPISAGAAPAITPTGAGGSGLIPPASSATSGAEPSAAGPSLVSAGAATAGLSGATQPASVAAPRSPSLIQPAKGSTSGGPSIPAQIIGSVSRPVSWGWLVLALIGALSIGLGTVKLPERLIGDVRSRYQLEDVR
jgi:hypothetical protein